MKKRILTAVITLATLWVCVVIAYNTPIKDTPAMNMIGISLSVVAILGLTLKLPDRLFYQIMAFDIIAAGFGTTLNFFRTVDMYDKVVHYISGIIVVEVGIILFEYFYRRYGVDAEAIPKKITVLAAMFVSFAGAAIWEIFEFSCDTFLGAIMQGGNSNTMGDIIAGFLGAITYGVIWFIANKKNENIDKKVL